MNFLINHRKTGDVEQLLAWNAKEAFNRDDHDGWYRQLFVRIRRQIS